MKFPAIMKEKRKLVLLLLTILLFALMNNYLSRKYYDKLDKNMSSIYEDRLMPASYIFQLSEHLYQKKLLLQEINENGTAASAIDSHNQAIGRIIVSYEKTYLTENEERYWHSFLASLERYNEEESAQLSSAAAANRHLSTHFIEALATLNKLNELQVMEGMKLQDDSKAIIQSTLMGAYFEVTLFFILGIVALRMLVTYEKTIYPVAGGNLLN
ncbi:MAG: MCP four helix bundle domain-containing protein [Chitinophagaceae bacterium]|nr:MCP four helix bundle domain-containing protein [Chitinophagaceae bacterium]MCW5927725.1 MCP four helix bundle domain-containing protein [Chitinophagaceae bacterium]